PLGTPARAAQDDPAGTDLDVVADAVLPSVQSDDASVAGIWVYGEAGHLIQRRLDTGVRVALGRVQSNHPICRQADAPGRRGQGDGAAQVADVREIRDHVTLLVGNVDQATVVARIHEAAEGQQGTIFQALDDGPPRVAARLRAFAPNLV